MAGPRGSGYATRRARPGASRAAAWPSLLLLAGFGCAPPVLVHTNGAPLAPGFDPVPIEGGWVGFDECAGGIHAVVEIEVGTRAAGGGIPDPRAALRFALSPRDVSAPSSVSISGPFCVRHPDAGDVGIGEPRPDEVVEYVTRPDRDCIYAIRAQFLLSHLPAPGEPVALRWDGRVVRFARR